MKMKLTIEEIVDMQHGFNEIRKTPALFGEQFSYACAKNRRAIRDHFETISEFEEDRINARKDFVKAMAKIGEDGEPVVVGDKESGAYGYEFASPKDHIKLSEHDVEAAKSMKAKYREVVEVNIHTIKEKDLPKNFPTSIYDKIFPMISFDDKPKEEKPSEE